MPTRQFVRTENASVPQIQISGSQVNGAEVEQATENAEDGASSPRILTKVRLQTCITSSDCGGEGYELGMKAEGKSPHAHGRS